MDRSIVIIVEHQQGKAAPINYELAALAHEMCQARPLEVKAVVLGNDPLPPAREMAGRAGIPVIALENPYLAEYNGELYKALLAEFLPPLDPLFVLVPQTTRGLDFAPGLAARLEAGCITGVHACSPAKGTLCFSRAAFNGKIVLDMVPTAKTAVLTIQPGAFKTLPPAEHGPGQIERATSTLKPKKTRSLGVRNARQQDAHLSEADVIVAAGRGIGKQENLILIQRLAALFPRSAVAGSRPLCDKDWLGYKSQVGLTGATVSPKLYISCSISGAVQHTTGMQGSGFIVAISTDPHAAIFNMADVCIVEDLTTFIPTFLEACKKGKDSPSS